MRIIKSICIILCLCSFSSVFGQTAFYTEDFNNGCVSLCLANTYPGWSISATGANSTFANNWYISCAENGNAPGTCGTGCGNDASLHVSNVAGSPGGLCPTGDCGAAYDASLASVVTNRRVESPAINCIGFSNIVVQYDYIGAQADLPLDGYTFVYSSNGGTTWINLGNGPASSCCCSALDCLFFGCCAPATSPCGSLRQGNWGQITLGLPASASNNPNVRIGFNWTNNGDNSGTDPSVAIDDLQVLGDPFLYTQVLQFSGQLNTEGAFLQWEIDSDRVETLELERSEDGTVFAPIASFPNLNHSSSDLPNSFQDDHLTGVRVFYRLRSLDGMGTSQLSQVLELSAEAIEQVDFFPNPVSRDQDLRLDVVLEKAQTVWVELVDLSGRQVLQKSYPLKAGSHGLHLSLTEAGPGVYLLRTRLGRVWHTGKVMVY